MLNTSAGLRLGDAGQHTKQKLPGGVSRIQVRRYESNAHGIRLLQLFQVGKVAEVPSRAIDAVEVQRLQSASDCGRSYLFHCRPVQFTRARVRRALNDPDRALDLVAVASSKSLDLLLLDIKAVAFLLLFA
ncbi:MAG: hypothetical protein H6831_08750 [Planctomycetes bacterium]|nr:hypothetical protein [Planctomycetota bacterium]